jgi:hypothetical protein
MDRIMQKLQVVNEEGIQTDKRIERKNNRTIFRYSK